MTTARLRHEHEVDRESRRIHLAKTITWRVLATTTTFTIVYALTGDIEAGAAVGGIEVAAKLVLYYAHERVWSKALTTGSASAPVEQFSGVVD